MQISNVLPTDDVLDSMSRLAAAAVTTDRHGDWTDRDELELELGVGWTDKPFCI